MIGSMKKDGCTSLEVTEDAQDEWERTVNSFVTPQYIEIQRQCMPSYFDNEGKAGDVNGLHAGRHPDLEDYVDILERWRTAGDFGGLVVD